MKHINKLIAIILSTAVILSFAIPVTVSAATIEKETAEMDLAREAAQRFISETGIRVFPEWEAADLTNGVAYHDLQGNIICYTFGISIYEKMIGRVVVGNSLYDFGVLEAGSGSYPTIPSDDEFKEAITKELDLDFSDLGKSMLVYLGYNRFYAIYEFRANTIGLNLLSKHLYKADELKSSIATPEECRDIYNNTNKEQGSE